MPSFNKVILMGNLTRDPQLSYLPSQTPVVELGLAVNRKYCTNDGQTREDVCFIDCRAMGKQAETINQYFKKGTPILIDGRLDFDQWEDQAGNKRSKHRVFIERFSFVSGQENQQNQPSNPYQGKPYPKPQYNQQPPVQQPPMQQPGSDGEEEIPF